MKKVIILGATGSIGKSALNVCRNYPDLLEIVAISAHSKSEELLEISKEFNIRNLALSGKSSNKDNKIKYYGKTGIINLIENTEADIVLNGITGAAGLQPSIATLNSDKDLALANKETIVMCGPLIKKLAKKNNKNILPVDSEHAAISHLLENRDINNVSELIITASGGPFFDNNDIDFTKITVEQALKHPTWDMGPKISIDSATLANKGLEVIEASRLFDFSVNKIKVVVHPQSIVHSMIRTIDNAIYAQLSKPDMQLPIQNAILYPDIRKVDSTYTDLLGLDLSFRKADMNRFPMLKLAFTAAEESGIMPLVYNAANEVAVEAFINRKIRFSDISILTERSMNLTKNRKLVSFEEAIQEDSICREKLYKIIEEL